ncbi:MAG: amidohydrolase [Anaerolineae bacterium]
MPDITELKAQVCAAIDQRRSDIITLGEDIRAHPELGFKEFRTAGLVSEWFKRLGIPQQTGLAVTGVKGWLAGRAKLVAVAYVGELDSILVRDHPEADPVTGAAHACGHNAQIANLLGVACGLAESGVMASLDGVVALMAAPAEEYVELEYRLGLKNEGKIEFLSGKQELLRIGAFSDIDLMLATHTGSRNEPGVISGGGPSNGCVAKLVRYTGRAAHAGGAPWDGVNALQAAQVALAAINAVRETFKDSDHIRVHPIITRGGDLVNVVPADVRMEMYVRGATNEAIQQFSVKIDRCLQAGALALGAEVQIETLAGYLPKALSQPLNELYKTNTLELLGASAWFESEFSAGSTDIGDVSQVIPAIEAVSIGAAGAGHSAEFHIQNPEVAYIVPAKIAAMTIIDLLANEAALARSVISAYQPAMTLTRYLDFMRSLNQHSDYDYRAAATGA